MRRAWSRPATPAACAQRCARRPIDSVASGILDRPRPASATDRRRSRDRHVAADAQRRRSRVIVGGLGLEAVVTAVHDGTADLDVRGKRMRASVRDLRVCRPGQPTARVSVNVQLADVRARLFGDAAQLIDLQRHRLHRRRGDLARRTLSRRVAADRSAASCGSFTATAPAS